MDAGFGVKRRYANRFSRIILPVLTITGILFFSMGLQFNSPALADDPIHLNYRTISAEDSTDQPDVTILTLEFEINNTGAMGYDNVSVAITSLSDAAADFGSITVGDLPVGVTRTVTGTVSIPNDSITDMTFRIDHS